MLVYVLVVQIVDTEHTSSKLLATAVLSEKLHQRPEEVASSFADLHARSGHGETEDLSPAAPRFLILQAF